MTMTYTSSCIALMLALAPLAAFAKDKTDGKSANLAVEKVICDRAFIKADPTAANYQSGVDVHGQPVAAADMNAPIDVVPEFISMPLTIDFAEKLQVNLPQGMEAKPSLGNLKLYQNGKIEFNGQDITKPVAVTCGIDPQSYSSQHTAPDYVPPVAVPQEEPVSGSVAPSMTSPEPKVVIRMPKGAVNVTDMPTIDSLASSSDDMSAKSQ